MRSALLPALIAGLLALFPHLASGQLRLDVSGGLAAPMTDLSDIADFGYNVAAGLNYGTPPMPIGGRLEGSLNGFSLKSTNDDVRVMNATANVVVNLGHRASSPYIIGGLGIYNSKFPRVDSENAVGVNLGGGLRFPVGGLGTFFEARYHAMLGNASSGTNLQYLPITLGVEF